MDDPASPVFLPSLPRPIPLLFLFCVAEGCRGRPCHPGVSLPTGERKKSHSPEYVEQPGAGPALPRCRSIPWAQIPKAEIFWELPSEESLLPSVLISLASSQALALTWQAPLAPINYSLFFSSLPLAVVATIQPFFLSLAADREEGDQEAQVVLGMWKVLQSLGQAAEKLGQAVGRLQAQEEEMRLQQSPQIWNRPRKVRLGGSEDPCGKRTASRLSSYGSSGQCNTRG